MRVIRSINNTPMTSTHTFQFTQTLWCYTPLALHRCTSTLPIQPITSATPHTTSPEDLSACLLTLFTACLFPYMQYILVSSYTYNIFLEVVNHIIIVIIIVVIIVVIIIIL